MCERGGQLGNGLQAFGPEVHLFESLLKRQAGIKVETVAELVDKLKNEAKGIGAMSILVLAEHDNAEVKPATLNTVTAALALDQDVHVLVAGSGCAACITRSRSRTPLRYAG